MKFSIKVSAAPFTHQGSMTALNLAKALLDQEHEIFRVFFYGDGANTGNVLVSPMKDQLDVRSEWIKLSKQYNFELVICIAGALNRGVLGKTESDQNGKDSFNLDPNFLISGLGQLVEAGMASDRVITFK